MCLSYPEKNGKTLHLFKVNSKKSMGERKRKKHSLLGTFDMCKDSKKQERQQEQMHKISTDDIMAPLPNTPTADADLKKKKK